MNKSFVQYGLNTKSWMNKLKFFPNSNQYPKSNPKVIFRFEVVYG